MSKQVLRHKKTKQRVDLTEKAYNLAQCLLDNTMENREKLNVSRWHAQLFINSMRDFYRILAIHRE